MNSGASAAASPRVASLYSEMTQPIRAPVIMRRILRLGRSKEIRTQRFMTGCSVSATRRRTVSRPNRRMLPRLTSTKAVTPSQPWSASTTCPSDGG